MIVLNPKRRFFTAETGNRDLRISLCQGDALNDSNIGYEKTMKKRNVMIGFLAALSWASVATYANTYEYDWTGGAPGYSGQIVLNTDTSPSGGGTLANIVSGSITTPTFGTFPIDLATVGLADPIFTWTPAGITEFHLGWLNSSSTHQGQVGQNYNGSGNNVLLDARIVSPYAANSDFSGSWLAAPAASNSVPDTGSTSAMLLGSLTALGAVARKFRSLAG